MRLGFVVSCALLLLSAGAVVGEEKSGDFLRLKPDEVQWKTPFGIGPAMAVLAGDPAKEGLYVVRVKFPPHTSSRPHYHPEERDVVVLKGTWYTGTGDSFDPAQAVPLGPGSFMMHPAKAVHWDGAKDEEVILQIVGYGPSGTVPVKTNEPMFTSQ
jgi:quercetin dioxygenase-like cupin family protein